MVKECTLNVGKLPVLGLSRNSVVRITERPDMTSAVNRGRKASNQTHEKHSDPDLNVSIVLCNCDTVCVIPNKNVN